MGGEEQWVGRSSRSSRRRSGWGWKAVVGVYNRIPAATLSQTPDLGPRGVVDRAAHSGFHLCPDPGNRLPGPRRVLVQRTVLHAHCTCQLFRSKCVWTIGLGQRR